MTDAERKRFDVILKDIWKCQADSSAKLNPTTFLKIQQDVIAEIKKIERNIRRARHSSLSTERKKIRVQQLEYDISIFRIIGDTLAWLLINPYIFRQHAKHPPNTRPLIDQFGFKAELAAARELSRMHEFVLVHAATNCLRIADLSILRPEGPQLIEVKSFRKMPSQKVIERLNRQLSRMEGLNKLLSDEGELDPEEVQKTFSVYPPEFSVVRGYAPSKVELKSHQEKIHYGPELNAALHEVLKDEQDRFVTFDGITAYWLRSCSQKRVTEVLKAGFTPLPKEQMDFIADGGMITTIDIYERHARETTIPPLTTLFDDKIASRLISGDLILITILNANRMAKYLESKGIVVDTNENSHFWKTHKFNVGKRRGGLLLYPLLHVMFAVHSAEYLADHCLDIERIYRHTKKRLLKKYKGGKIIEFD